MLAKATYKQDQELVEKTKQRRLMLMIRTLEAHEEEDEDSDNPDNYDVDNNGYENTVGVPGGGAGAGAGAGSSPRIVSPGQGLRGASVRGLGLGQLTSGDKEDTGGMGQGQGQGGKTEKILTNEQVSSGNNPYTM